jgi:type II secretory pathway component PulF
LIFWTNRPPAGVLSTVICLSMTLLLKPEFSLLSIEMNDITLEEVFALNEELASLSAAGVPIELGATDLSTEEALTRINARLALRTSLGQPISAALTDDQELPPLYQHALLTGLESNQLSLALEGVSRQPAAWNDLRKTAAQALIQPLIVLALAYCGFIFLCLRFAPNLADIYEQIRMEANGGVRFLTICRAWMPVWVPLVPLLIIVAIIAWRRQSNLRRPWLPGSGRYFAAVTHAMFAEQLASLLEAHVPLPESLRLASQATGDRALIAACNTIGAAHERGEQLTAADNHNLTALPPLLRWALTGDLGGESLPQILHFAAETYRQSAERQAAMWHVALPTLVGAFLGGLIVLGYGLSVFGPYISLLRDLAF